MELFVSAKCIGLYMHVMFPYLHKYIPVSIDTKLKFALLRMFTLYVRT